MTLLGKLLICHWDLKTRTVYYEYNQIGFRMAIAYEMLFDADVFTYRQYKQNGGLVRDLKSMHELLTYDLFSIVDKFHTAKGIMLTADTCDMEIPTEVFERFSQQIWSPEHEMAFIKLKENQPLKQSA